MASSMMNTKTNTNTKEFKMNQRAELRTQIAELGKQRDTADLTVVNRLTTVSDLTEMRAVLTESAMSFAKLLAVEEVSQQIIDNQTIANQATEFVKSTEDKITGLRQSYEQLSAEITAIETAETMQQERAMIVQTIADAAATVVARRLRVAVEKEETDRRAAVKAENDRRAADEAEMKAAADADKLAVLEAARERFNIAVITATELATKLVDAKDAQIEAKDKLTELPEDTTRKVRKPIERCADGVHVSSIEKQISENAAELTAARNAVRVLTNPRKASLSVSSASSVKMTEPKPTAPCKYGKLCRNPRMCGHLHGADATKLISTKLCKHGDKCRSHTLFVEKKSRFDCTYLHKANEEPKPTVRAGAGGPDVSSDEEAEVEHDS